MKIKRLEIKNRATLADVKADFGDINVIYGRNGAGKTLMSEIFRAAENGVAIEPGTATLRLDDGRRVNSSQFKNGEFRDKIRVFNRKFVEENVFGRNPAAIVLGHEVKAERDRAEALQGTITELEVKSNGLQIERDTEQAKIDELKTNRGREIRDGLGPVARIEGAHPRWRHFDKSDVDRIAGEIGTQLESYNRDEKQIKMIVEALGEHSFLPLKEIAIGTPDLSGWSDEAMDLCATKLGTSLVNELKSDRELASWLESGIRLMGSTSDCPFCKQEVPDDRIDQLRRHFAKTHAELGERVDGLVDRISRWLSETEDPKLPSVDELRVDLREVYRVHSKGLDSTLKLHRRAADYLLQRLKRKRADLSADVQVETTSYEWSEDAVGAVNSLILAHNDIGEVVSLGEEYERAMVATIMPQLMRGQREVKRLENQLSSISREIEDSRRDLQAALMESRSEARAASQLTELLGDFIGHREITFQLNEDGSTFRVERGGAKAVALSEGELNALGLMYFLMRLMDDRFDPQGSIVVFDDPITSFDDQRIIDAVARILYRTGVRGSTDRDVGQVFFFTHHLGLLDRLWRELKSPRFGAGFFEMRSSTRPNDSDRLTSIVKVKKPTRFRYHVAFEEVYNLAPNPDSNPVTNPGNSIRLCIEGFLFNLAPTAFGDGADLENALRKVYRSYEATKMSDEDIHALCRAANAGSHDDLPDRPINDADQLATFQGAALRLLNLIEEVAPKHYEDMVRGVKERRKP